MVLESPQTFRSMSGQGLLVGAHISIKDMARLDDALALRQSFFCHGTISRPRNGEQPGNRRRSDRRHRMFHQAASLSRWKKLSPA